CLTHNAPNSGAGTSASAPPIAPMGVRMPETINASPAMSVALHERRAAPRPRPGWSHLPSSRCPLHRPFHPLRCSCLKVAQLVLERLLEVVQSLLPLGDRLGPQL